MVDANNSNTTLTPGTGSKEVKPLEQLIDGSRLPPQENARVSGSNKIVPRKIGIKKTIIIAVLALLVVSVLSMVLAFLKRVPRTLQNKGELVWWGLQEEDSVVSPLIAEFQAANPDVRVTYIHQSEKDYADRLYNSLKNGKGPDIFEIHTSWIPDYRGLMSSLPQSIMSDEEYKNTFLTSIYNTLKTNGAIIGIPLYYDALTLYINVDIFNNARKEPPKTWNDLLFLSDPDKGGLTLFSGKEIVQSAVALGSSTNVDHWQDILALVMYQNKINPANPDLKLVNEAISYLRDFQRNGVWSDRLPSSTVTFSRGNLAMYFGTMSRAPEMLRLNPSLRFKTVPLPQLPNNTPTDPQYSYANYYFQAVDKSSTNETLAWKFLAFLSEKNSIVRLNQGRKSLRAFDFPPPRKDMVADYEKDPVIGSVMNYSDVAKTWYLADKAEDGDGGINTNITKLYKEAFDKGSVNNTFAATVKTTLSKFGVSSQ